MRVRDLIQPGLIRFTDQIYRAGHRDAPVLTFPRPAGHSISYTRTAISKIGSNWPREYIAQYIPETLPREDADRDPAPEHLRGRIVTLVSTLPAEGSSRDFVRPGAWRAVDLDRWPDAIPLREVWRLVDPPRLRTIYEGRDQDRRALTSGARGRLGTPGPELSEALADCEVEPVLDLYRSTRALEIIQRIGQPVDGARLTPVVANRRSDTVGYVYALSLPQWPGLLKIGFASDVSARIGNLSTGIPVDYTLEASALYDDCRKAEDAVHRTLAARRVRTDREWFRVTRDEFLAAVRATDVGPVGVFEGAAR